jgi:hypothetical protein
VRRSCASYWTRATTRLLVHGWRPVASELFERMLALTLDFLGVERRDLPALPVMPEA